MADIQPLYGTDRSIPGDGDTNWGPEVRQLLVDVCKGLNTLSILVNNQAFLLYDSADIEVATSTGISIVEPRHDVKNTAGSDGILTITSIADGNTSGQVAMLVGHKDNTATRFVKLDTTNTANVAINGDMQLKPGASVFLMWDTADSGNTCWRELSRSI